MAELTSASVQGESDGPSDTQTRAKAARRDWTTRSALLFWIAASGVVWVAVAVSAIWVY